MKFLELYNLLTEANDFSDLPKSPPYGFWVYPDGRYKTVRYSHELSGHDILEEEDLYQDYNDYNYDNVGFFLQKNGFIRMVKEFNCSEYHMEYEIKIAKAIKTAMDIKEWYDM